MSFASVKTTDLNKIWTYFMTYAGFNRSFNHYFLEDQKSLDTQTDTYLDTQTDTYLDTESKVKI